ncbi:MAG: hypothetical protein U5Q44_00080 [Dehalococcoidia bacterium]|nr:hypothetical protein [Dehalococcoidia bacterium]
MGSPEWVSQATLDASREESTRLHGEVIHLWLKGHLPRKYYLAGRDKYGGRGGMAGRRWATSWRRSSGRWNTFPSADEWDGMPEETYYDYQARRFAERRAGAAN